MWEDYKIIFPILNEELVYCTEKRDYRSYVRNSMIEHPEYGNICYITDNQDNVLGTALNDNGNILFFFDGEEVYRRNNTFLQETIKEQMNDIESKKEVIRELKDVILKICSHFKVDVPNLIFYK